MVMWTTVGRVIWPVLRYIIFWSLAQGVILFSWRKGRSPDRWVLRVIDAAATPENLTWAAWLLAGALALVGSIAWETLGVSSKLKRKWQGTQHEPASVPTVTLECTPILWNKITVSPDQTYYTASLSLGGLGGLGEFSNISGHHASLHPEGWRSTIYKCQITNYGDHPLFHLSLILQVTFLEKVYSTKDNTNLYNAGDEVSSTSWPITIAKVDSGVDRPFIFYVHTTTDLFARVTSPTGITAKASGTAPETAIPLTVLGSDVFRYVRCADECFRRTGASNSAQREILFIER